MTRDDFDTMWGADDPPGDDPPISGCVLVMIVFVAVWSVVIVGAAFMVTR